jgi:hypothetical protein
MCSLGVSERLPTLNIYIIIFYFSAISMLAICSYGIYASATQYTKTKTVIIGQVIVGTEFPIHGAAKLVTYLMVLSVISWYSAMKLVGNKLSTVPSPIKSVLQVVILIACVISLYEFVYNFFVWSSLITYNLATGHLDLDSISISYPNPNTPWNLVFATKMTLAGFLISAHAFYLVTKPSNSRRVATKG